jgi:hypothetical protein
MLVLECIPFVQRYRRAVKNCGGCETCWPGLTGSGSGKMRRDQAFP